MTAKETRDLSVTELDTKIREAREQLIQLRLRKQTGQVEKTHTLRAIRKDVARMETIRAEKSRAAAKAA
ncbi:50S ribosomal protein L29 [Termitidicoccus mucosus]|uniref:Large ribosomal subunit protein uL29 n=1 Tax=Termitidicoccus mucosus TaxID=1184151 RepID=A0A178ILG6_9BACT|nr:50S ribosomal protein L29 [Opitutaceae bacterium TSB47]